MRTLLLLLFVIVLSECQAEKSFRESRLFNNVVNFRLDSCPSTSAADVSGTCLASPTECTAKGGMADGNCAQGFGVCCVFTTTECEAEINQNGTYVRNPGFPAAFGMVLPPATPTAQNCMFTIKRVESGRGDICQIRLDFQTTTRLEVAPGGICADTMTVSSPAASSAKAFPSPICGTLTGQHMYFESGSTGDAGTVQIFTDATNTARHWNIKITYIECSNLLRPPTGCAQYFVGASGNVKSLNFDGAPGVMLRGQNMFPTCVRQEVGFCTIAWFASTDLVPLPFNTEPALPFTILGTSCSSTQVRIPGNLPICGNVFSSVPGTTVNGIVRGRAPFRLTTVTAASAMLVTGFNLNYAQNAC